MITRESVETVFRVKDLKRSYPFGRGEVHALKGITLDIQPREMTAIVGRSGSGKTTLLNLIAGLDKPTSGEVWYRDRRIDSLGESDLLALRGAEFGFVFQSFGLLPLLTATENVGVPLRMRQMAREERERRVLEALTRVGLAKRAKHRPYELSGGEQQRVAIARALAAKPHVILADEPTGQLDSATGQRIIDLLRSLVMEDGLTVVIVTHDPKVMNAADVVHEMRDGNLIETRRID